MSNYFITGATGFVGKHLVKKLAYDGHNIKILVRKSSDISNLRIQNVDFVYGDVRDQSSFVSALHGIDVVYHLAGIVTDWAPLDLFESVHVEGTKNVLEAANIAKVKLFIHMSTLDVLEKTKLANNHYMISEDSPYSKSDSPYIRTKITAEKFVISYSKQKKLNYVVARPVWIYGPGDRVFFPEIAYQMKKGSMVYIGSPNNLIQMIYIDNLINCLVRFANESRFWGHTISLHDSEQITLKEICDYLTEKLNLKRVSLVLPYSLAYIVAVGYEFFGHLFAAKKRPLLTRTAVEMLGQNVEIKANQSDNLLKGISRVTMKDGLARSIDWLGQNNLANLRREKPSK